MVHNTKKEWHISKNLKTSLILESKWQINVGMFCVFFFPQSNLSDLYGQSENTHMLNYQAIEKDGYFLQGMELH